MEKITIIGSGTHAKELINIVLDNSLYEITGIICDYGEIGKEIYKKEIIGNISLDSIHKISSQGLIAIGNNNYRIKTFNKLIDLYPDFGFVKVIHPDTVISSSAEIGEGTSVQAGTVIKNNTNIGKHCNINSNVSIGHVVIIEDFVTIGPGVNIGGQTVIKRGTSINMGANIRDRIEIGEFVVIGMSSNVIHDLPSNVKAYGNPVNIIEKRKENDNYF